MKKLSVLGALKSAFEISILLHRRGNMKNITMRVVLLTLCVTMTLSTANATQLLDIDVASGQGPVLGGGGTIGYEFTLDSETTVRALGTFDVFSDGISFSGHQVGLFDNNAGNTGTLLASATITNASIVVASGITGLTGNWLYENITPVVLAAGVYRMGTTQGDIAATRDNFAQGTVVFNLAGSKGSGFFASGGDGTTLTFPTVDSNDDGFFGPNFDTAFVGAAAVPEPSTFALLTIGLFALGLKNRRKKRL